MGTTTRELGVKSLVGACMLAMSAGSLAASFTYTAGNPGYPRPMGQLDFGQGRLDLGRNWTGLMDTAKIQAAPVQEGAQQTQLEVPRDTDGFYTAFVQTSALAGATIDADSHVLTRFDTTGGFVLTAPVLKSVSSGGSLGITDLGVDLNTRTIVGTVAGGNGVGTRANVALWSIGDIQSSIVYQGSNTCPNVVNMCDYFGAEGFDRFDVRLDLRSLAMTAEATSLVRQSLGLLTLGGMALDGVLVEPLETMSVTARFQVPPQFNLSAVPEPATWALISSGMGLVGMALARRPHQMNARPSGKRRTA
jgi:hypothetical protein